MDGHEDDEQVPPPAGLMDVLRARDPAVIALRTASEREGLRPVDVPALPMLSEELDKLMGAQMPTTVPEALRNEHRRYCQAREARANAKAENKRRLRTLLWCEAELRKHKRSEHIAVRYFNRKAWGMTEPVSDDYSVREQQVRAHA